MFYDFLMRPKLRERGGVGGAPQHPIVSYTKKQCEIMNLGTEGGKCITVYRNPVSNI